MKSFESWRTWVGILALLLFAGVATVAGPWLLDQFTGGGTTIPLPQEQEPITIQLEDYLLGEVLVEAPLIQRLDGVEVHPLVLTGILTALVVGGIVVIGIPLGLIYVRLDNTTRETKEDDTFQEAQSTLEKREREKIKELEEKQPPGEIPSHKLPRWSAISTSAIILMFVFLTGMALADTFFSSDSIELLGNVRLDPAVPFVGILLLVTGVILAVVFQDPQAVEAVAAEEGPDESAVSWGTIWVIVTGLIFLVVGTGLILVIRSGGS